MSMKAWAQSQPGDFDYKLEDSRPIPKASAGQVIIKNKAVGINPIDYKAPAPAFGGTDYSKTKVYGVDGAGTISEVGEGVKDFAVGDLVWYFTGLHHGQGSYGEYSLAEAGHVFKIPKGFEVEQAGTAACILLTCAIALIDKMNIRPGDEVLVRGSSGGVGHLATQIAKALGASKVVGICSGGKFEFCKTQGKCDECIDYTKGEEHIASEVKRLTNGSGFPKVFDTVSTDVEKFFGCVQNGGQVATILPVPLDGAAAFGAFGNNISLHNILVLSYVSAPHNVVKARAMADKIVNEMIVPGKVAIHISKKFKFTEVMDALKDNAQGRTIGKTVVLVE